MSSWVSRSVLSVVLLGAWPVAQACEVGEQKVQQVMSARVATYDDKGDFKDEIGKDKIQVDVPLVECKESPALVKVKTTDGADVWVDRLDVKIVGGAVKPRTCKAQVISRESDTKAPAVSGVDPCSG
jgi:hypothetical protein